MLTQILIGCALIIVTVLLHALGMSVSLRFLKRAIEMELDMASLWVRALVIAAVVLILLAAILFEAGVWAATYSALGAISDLEEALYFSMVTYTTLGYGDVVLDEQWRLLASIEAANGLIIFAWSTALIVLALGRISRLIRDLKAMD